MQSTGNEITNAVKHAIDVGYRHIDTAYFYQNEADVGLAIRDKINEGVIKREDIFLTTKVNTNKVIKSYFIYSYTAMLLFVMSHH